MAPRVEKRADPDTGDKYTWWEFVEYYGEKKAAKKWDAAEKKAAAPKASGKACTVCGNTNHSKADCKFKDKECNICGKVGHLAKVCRSAAASGGGAAPASKKAAKTAPASGKACSVCGNTNHLKADCKFKDKECSVCGKVGHLAKVCRAAGGGAEKGGATAKKKAAPEKAKKERPPRALATEGEIPIKRVARVYRATVKDEEGALKLDALANEVQNKLRENRKEKAKGFVKLVRMVCKTEWACEVNIIWRSFEDFAAYKESEFRKEVSGEFEAKIKDIITGDFYTGVRVYDEL